jgi:2-hydroxycyclohexanecarboxyl-CoA dehydrogenase
VTGPAGSPVALVTGAASGIGAAIAARQRERGWTVAGLDLRECDADLALVADVTDADAVAEAVTAAQDRLGALDAVVCAAGHYEMTPIEEIEPERWTRMLRVHVGGLLNVARAVVPAMIASGTGRIVAISSELAIGGGDGDAHYAAAKGAALGLMRSLAAELAPHGVLVNAVAPGPTDTPLLAPDSPWREPGYLSTLPARRLARPDEVARVVGFLLDEGTFLAGEVLSVNSGAVI